jgi:hypothetical protein
MSYKVLPFETTEDLVVSTMKCLPRPRTSLQPRIGSGSPGGLAHISF